MSGDCVFVYTETFQRAETARMLVQCKTSVLVQLVVGMLGGVHTEASHRRFTCTLINLLLEPGGIRGIFYRSVHREKELKREKGSRCKQRNELERTTSEGFSPFSGR